MTSVSPKVSVVCSVYNRAVYICETIDSLLAQDFDDFEIVLINDGSPDPRIREFLGSYSDPRLRVIHQENTGFTVAIRRAIDAARGKYIAVQGAGDVSFPTRLTTQYEYLLNNKGVSAVGTWSYIIKVGTSAPSALIKRPQKTVFSHKDLLKENPFTHGGIMFSRQVYDQVGGYRPFFKLAQDRDLWCRMSLKAPMHMIQVITYVNRRFPDGVSTSIDKVIEQAAFSDMALQFLVTRVNYGHDEVDLLGNNAVLMRKLTLRYAKILISAWAIYRHHSKPDYANLMLSSLRSSYLPVYLFLRICMPALDFVVEKSLANRLGFVGRYISCKLDRFLRAS